VIDRLRGNDLDAFLGPLINERVKTSRTEWRRRLWSVPAANNMFRRRMYRSTARMLAAAGFPR
jgi:hypothetical protein